MKKLDISITKAQLQGFTVTLDSEGKPSVSASLALLTEGGKKITDYSASTWAYSGEKLDVPPEAFAHLGQAGKLIEESIVKHCRDSQLTLGSGNDDAPIDLSEIPF